MNVFRLRKVIPVSQFPSLTVLQCPGTQVSRFSDPHGPRVPVCQSTSLPVYQHESSDCTVAQIALFWFIFVQNIWFWHKLAHYEKMCLKKAKKGSMPRVSIHNWSFEPNLTAIFKYLLAKTVRRNPVLSVFLRPKNEPTIEFRRTVLDSWYLNIVVKLGSNDQLWIETRGIEPSFAILRHIFSYCADIFQN